MKSCSKCGTTEDKQAFVKGRNRCKLCYNKYFYSKRNKRRTVVNELKRNKPCHDCGKSFHPIAMDYDHINPAEKEDDVAMLIDLCVSMKRITDEIAKCELVCANCHRIRTFIRAHGLEEYEQTK